MKHFIIIETLLLETVTKVLVVRDTYGINFQFFSIKNYLWGPTLFQDIFIFLNFVFTIRCAALS